MSSTPEIDARAARTALERLLVAAPLDLPDGFLDRVERFVALLLDANRRLNLTRLTEPEAVARLHLLDALAGLPRLDAIGGDRVLDLGSGGGVPGLVLAMARPDRRFVLLDSVAKKVDAVRAFVDELELANVTTRADRAELLGRDPEHRANHDIVTARACASLPVLVEYALPLVRVGGALLAWKGPLSPDELAAGSTAAAQLGGTTPSVERSGFEALGDHRFVLVFKAGDTPDRFPRRPGEPSRRPLA